MKAFSRKARATEQGNLLRTGGGLFPPPQSPQQGAIITMVEEAAPNMICEINNCFDSDGILLNAITKKQEADFTEDILDSQGKDIIVEKNGDNEHSQSMIIPSFDDKDITGPDKLCTTPTLFFVQPEQLVRKPADYIRREAIIRIKMLEAKKKLQMQILKEKLETQEIKKQAAKLEDEINRILLEKAKSELEELKRTL